MPPMPALQGQTLPVQVERCNLSIVSLEVNEVEEIRGRLFLSLLSEKKGGIMPWTQTAAGSRRRQLMSMTTGQGKRPLLFCMHRDCVRLHGSQVLWAVGSWNHPIRLLRVDLGTRIFQGSPSDSQEPVYCKPLLKGCLCQSSAGTRTKILYSTLIPQTLLQAHLLSHSLWGLSTDWTFGT